MNNEELIKLAIEAKKNARTPTKYYVGAALKTKSGNVYTGCNLGSENGIFNICAERVAIVKMLSEGEEEIEKIVVVGGKEDELVFTLPCGVCRQLILDMGEDIEIVAAYYENGELTQKSYNIRDLLPAAFEFENKNK